MAKNLDKMTTEALLAEINEGREDVNSLNLSKPNQKEAFLKAVEAHPAILKHVSRHNEATFFKLAIKKNYKWFVQLKREQYTDELAQFYIYNRLTDVDDKKAETKSNTSIMVQKSMDDKTVFIFSFVTAEGDELYYLDKELQVPVSLKSSFKLTLKLTDAVALIDKLDTTITQLGEQKIKTMITDTISNQYKAYLNQHITERQIGYYTLCTTFADIEAGFKCRLADVFAPYGISVSEFVIKKIAIPKDIQNKLEDQAFKIRQMRADVEADAEFAKLSLESYEAKLAIQDKYPNAEATLTEYEKDLALKRYMTKLGRVEEETIDRSIKISQKVERQDSEVTKSDDAPEVASSASKFKKVFIAISAAALALSLLIMITAGAGAGFIVLGIAAVALGIVGALNIEKLKGTPAIPAATSISDTPTTDEPENKEGQNS